jgi:F-type H+-transporting ATPase subunit gamma
MANLKEIRKRIGSVKNTQQITKAMKMVAAAKLRRAQESLLQGRPYAQHLFRTISRLAASADPTAHPLLGRHGEGKKACVLIISSERGLCGGFNTNLIKAAERYITAHKKDFDSMELRFIGRKAFEYFRRRPFDCKRPYTGVFDNLHIEHVEKTTELLIQDFLNGTFDCLFVVYNEFKSVISQKPLVEQLLPIVASEEDRYLEPLADNYLYEPSRDELLRLLLPQHINTQLFRALKESFASEMGARMSAMDSATKNASELIEKLTLSFNRARQAAITTELVEIISGAAAT